MSLTPEERKLRAKAASNARWAKELDRSAAVRPAVEGRLRRLEQQIDPEGVLPAGERRQRAEQLRRSQLQAASLKGSRASAERRARGAA